MKYDIPAKPTMYNGRLYRSRLEARYAAMYDILNYKYEYEPFDLPGWSPDFLLQIDIDKVLIEVKPISNIRELEINYLEKLIKAVKGTDYRLAVCGSNNEIFIYQEWPMVFGSHDGKNVPECSVFLPRLDLSNSYTEAWKEAANVVQFLKPL